MLPKSNFRRSALCLMLALAALSAGCGQARQAIATAIGADNAPDTLRNVRQKIADGQYKAARDEGEAFLEGHTETTKMLAWELAKASVQLGDNERAIYLVEQAIRARVVTGVDLLSEPMLEPLRNDPRLALLAGGMRAGPRDRHDQVPAKPQN
ncbi:MAG TPA: hypothetical protein VF861_02260 [Telluria sp.]